ncbi:L-type lectin-domain containing receptor kinase IX.1-like [Vicia villosa]|uniref:L-type lectin-domain containing receptor kinase IX.1-like n=1 Tax=Vicia villosa TaxID=3911 RepID=UPI00273BF2BA|nr:L-type lectin-domain containing receptor kinase IX.1-like [Vicia villosa]
MFNSPSSCSSSNIINLCKYIILILSLLFFTLPETNSLFFNITNFDDPTVSNNISYQGDGQSSNGSINLNKVSDISRVGRAIYSQPLHLWDKNTKTLTHFTTSFTFTIDKVNNKSYADGFVFYIAPLGYQIPPNSAGSVFGLFNDTTNSNALMNYVVAVEFDTHVGATDPPMTHVGIDDNSLTSVAVGKFDIDNNLGKICYVLIDYNSDKKMLEVFWSFHGRIVKGVGNGNGNSSLSYQIDLMQKLPEYVNIGFSASTGLLRESNVIHSWEFSSNLKSDSSVDVQLERNGGKGSLKTVVIVVPVVLVFLIASVVGWLIVKRKRKNVNDGLDEYGIPVPAKFDLDKATIPRRFEYSELVAATNGFADDRMLGRGGYGQVYKGALSYLGRVVAVKRIFADFENSERVFINEVRIISRLIHRNLVQFIGWCHEQGEFLLVFEYMPNGSLDTHLFGDKKSLAWEVRYRVALGVVNALRYLHDDAEQCVLHRDIKSANVLLDTDFSTKLGDFGMAKLVDPMLRTQRTGVVGTYGYLAPEYINGGRASKESDMYSFGIVALELATGRRIFQDGEFHVPLMNWVWGLYVAGNLMSAADERLNKEFDVSEMKSLLIVGLWCTHSNDKERPKAYEVIKVLQNEMALPELPLDMHDRAPPIVGFRPLSNAPSLSPSMTNSLVSVGR